MDAPVAQKKLTEGLRKQCDLIISSDFRLKGFRRKQSMLESSRQETMGNDSAQFYCASGHVCMERAVPQVSRDLLTMDTRYKCRILGGVLGQIKFTSVRFAIPVVMHMVWETRASL